MKLSPWPVYPDPCPNLLVERGPENKGVGSWVPNDKHRYVADYLAASKHAWKKWPHRIYIDPFSGPGRIQVRGETHTRDGGAMVAWRQLEKGGAPFTKMLIGDLRGDRVHACVERLKASGADAVPFIGAAVDTVPNMVRHVPKGALCFAYVDPYNLQFLSFSLLRQLAELKVDLAVHFSTMDLLRNVDHELDPTRARFDEVAPGWRDDPKVIQSSKATLPAEFLRCWMAHVEGLGFTGAKAMPLVTNDSNHGLYRMVFFARHDLPLRIWNDVAGNNTRDLFG